VIVAEHVPDNVTLDVLQANVDLLAQTERLEGERRRLLELDRIRSEFLARVSHDLRTPLNSIIGFSDLLLAGHGGRPNRKHLEFVSAINRNGHALLAMINDLLDLSTIEAGQLKLRRTTVPLATVLDDLRAATEPVLLQAGLVPVWPERDALAGKQVTVDRRRLLQALLNLVDNSRKFTPAGGRVQIAMDAGPDRATFSVRDTGPGIPAEERDLIFRPYYQRPPTASGRGDGVGLGLVIVRAIIELHRGTIVIDSDAGRGCAFHLTLPGYALVADTGSAPVLTPPAETPAATTAAILGVRP
jgi:signal transduction histidine kinase